VPDFHRPLNLVGEPVEVIMRPVEHFARDLIGG
jgi:hypothetical protein